MPALALRIAFDGLAFAAPLMLAVPIPLRAGGPPTSSLSLFFPLFSESTIYEFEFEMMGVAPFCNGVPGPFVPDLSGVATLPTGI